MGLQEVSDALLAEAIPGTDVEQWHTPAARLTAFPYLTVVLTDQDFQDGVFYFIQSVQSLCHAILGLR